MIILAEKTSDVVEVNRKPYSSKDGKKISNRSIVFLDDVVIKFDTGRNGWKAQCNAEGLTFNTINANDKKYFATVKAFGNNWIVMSKVSFYHIDSSCVTDKQRATAERTLDRLKDKYGLFDIHNENYGIDDITGKLIIFDYVSHKYHNGAW
jgi:hypothetical protein